MARVALNALTDGISGALGNLVFRQYGNKTVVSQKAAKPTTQSIFQKENRMKFREATLYAKSAMLDPQKKPYYQQKAKKLNLPNAYTAAITDFMRRNKAKRINTLRSSPVIKFRNTQQSTILKSFQIQDSTFKGSTRDDFVMDPLLSLELINVMHDYQISTTRKLCLRASP